MEGAINPNLPTSIGRRHQSPNLLAPIRRRYQSLDLQHQLENHKFLMKIVKAFQKTLNNLDHENLYLNTFL